MLTDTAGAPVFISKPHFLDADPYYASRVAGMQPNRSLHDENLMIEPMSGVAMQVVQRGQLNLYVTASLLYPNIAPAYVPVSWIEQVYHFCHYSLRSVSALNLIAPLGW